jgi:hypothetical protein
MESVANYGTSDEENDEKEGSDLEIDEEVSFFKDLCISESGESKNFDNLLGFNLKGFTITKHTFNLLFSVVTVQIREVTTIIEIQ